MIEDGDSEEREISEADFMTCPITMQKVDPDVMIVNTAILKETEHFLDENPWAYEFDPRENFMNIKL